ncbi:MAG TPA: DUF432 domain-containing protein [Pyrodictium delaneyi]|uniref:DUF432 domain-containing protein n=1 Tax=Pyrodictium delaneyi TaxID=1273541 RepID=A0A833E8F2_9CREN|nr:DUF432 domain-containing protein [Pyrodictium delaneyi]
MLGLTCAVRVDTVFGRISFGEHDVCRVQLRLERYGDRCRYRRGSVSALVPCDDVYVYPMAPVLYPEYLTSYIMLKLQEPVMIRHGGKEEFWARLEFDVAIVVGSGDAGYEVVDVFPSSGIGKYALYGSPNRGIIVRFVPVEVLFEPLEEPCKALVRVTVHNRSIRPIRLSRIVFPAQPFNLYYDDAGRVAGSSIYVAVTSPFTAVVSLRELNLPDGFRKAPRLLGQKGGVAVQTRWSQSFVMNYGL